MLYILISEKLHLQDWLLPPDSCGPDWSDDRNNKKTSNISSMSFQNRYLCQKYYRGLRNLSVQLSQGKLFPNKMHNGSLTFITTKRRKVSFTCWKQISPFLPFSLYISSVSLTSVVQILEFLICAFRKPSLILWWLSNHPYLIPLSWPRVYNDNSGRDALGAIFNQE